MTHPQHRTHLQAQPDPTPRAHRTPPARVLVTSLAAGLLAASQLTGCASTASALKNLATTGPHPGRNAATNAPRPGAGAGSGDAQAGSALAALSRLPVKGRAPKTGYSRAQFGPPYSDKVDVPTGHNRCTQVADIRRRDTTDARPDGRCAVSGGYINDPYSRQRIDPHTAQLEHVVALGDAWQSGAATLNPQQRANLAGDPLNLLMVTGRLNASKQESNAASWLPPNKAFRCRYASLQIAVKTKYQLWVTPAEARALKAVLAQCPNEPLATETDPTVRVPPPRP